MEKTVKWFAAAAGAVAGLFMRMPIAVRLLVLLMGLDYLSGVGVEKSAVRHRCQIKLKSPRSNVRE